MKISKELTAASATPIILGLLERGESYGYAIAQQVEQLSEGKVVWTDGMLYPILHRLEAEGVIGSRWGESDTGRKRKYYHLRPEARTVLQQERQQWNVINLILARLWEPQKP